MNSKLFKVAIALTFGISAGAFATDTAVHNDDFTAYPDGAAITNCSISTGSWQAGADDKSTVVVSGQEAYLKLETDGSTLTNLLASTAADSVNDALENGESIFFESSVKFVSSDSLMSQEIGGADAKFAIYALAEDESQPMKLVVYHKYFDDNAGNGGEFVYTNEVFDTVTLSRDDYTKVRVEYKLNSEIGYYVFNVAIDDGSPVESSASVANMTGDNEDSIWMLSAVGSGSTDAEIKSVCFQGTGAVDSVKVGTIEEAGSEGVEADDGNGNTFTVLAATVEALEALNINPLATVSGTEITYAQADALGLLNLTTGAVAEVPEATIEITENGVEVTMGEGAKAGYTVTAYLLAKSSITAAWPTIENAVASGPYGTTLVDDSDDAAAKFYKVVVTIE